MKKSCLSIKEFKRFLKELGFTQKQFANFLGLSEQTLKKWVKDQEIPYYAEIIIKQKMELDKFRKEHSCIDELLEDRIKNILSNIQKN
ncbi:helix-turn-helix domain-containing protein [Nitrosophilus labii]|uniref:helix-turn-helix domain-containing protein n=1 Tax=Nitrosophilus labii TaxID=2706014 RepID=UPI00165705E4|nr:helix-turn-helix domain-containing protein [Nitrosophilus labii]